MNSIPSPGRTCLLLIFLCCSTSLQAQQVVSLQSISELSFSQNRLFPAQVDAMQMSTVATEASGRVIDMPVQIGDRIKTGQTLLSIDCETPRIRQRQAEAALKRLRAQRQLTRQQLDRAERLLASRSISREELDQRQTQLDADDASIEEQQAILQTTQRNIEDCQLKAPFSGQVINKHLSLGAYVAPGTPVIDLLNPRSVEVALEMPIGFIDEIRTAEDIQFVTDNRRYPVTIRSILPWVNPSSHQQAIRLSFTGNDRPPAGVRGRIGYQTPAHYLPAELIQKRQGHYGIFVSENNKARFIPLPDAQQGQAAAVNLPHNTLIIVSPLQLIKDQMPVKTDP